MKNFLTGETQVLKENLSSTILTFILSTLVVGLSDNLLIFPKVKQKCIINIFMSYNLITHENITDSKTYSLNRSLLYSNFEKNQ